METQRHFYPRSPCGERLTTLTTSRRTEQFLSTLSLRRATTHADNRACKTAFLSTLSLRRATCRLGLGLVRRAYFYPRSPCGERHATILVLHNPQYFYPRSPCGERLVQPRLYPASTIFLSTLSLRRATSPRRSSTVTPSISIHALLAESDQWFINGKGRLAYFYPRSPCGERPDV